MGINREAVTPLKKADRSLGLPVCALQCDSTYLMQKISCSEAVQKVITRQRNQELWLTNTLRLDTGN
jgi:hypothetical protein